MARYEIPAFEEVAVPDGGRWIILYHDGDEESSARTVGSRVVLGETSGSWQVATSAAPPVWVRRLTPDE